MNLLIDHAALFKRNRYCAVVLYTTVCMVAITWGVVKGHSFERQINILEEQIGPMQKKISQQSWSQKKDDHSMKKIKNHVAHLFAIPLDDISFYMLSADTKEIRIHGKAKETAVLEKWLKGITKFFSIESRTSHTAEDQGLRFEVILHEKL